MKILLIILITSLPSVALSTDYLPDTIEQNSSQFERCNTFTLRYGFILKVAEIGWYSPDCSASVPILQATDKIVRFHYLKNVSGDFFRQSAEEYFLLNLSNSEQHNLLKQPLIEFNSNYTDIKSGEYFDLVQINDSNLSLYKNQQLLSVSQNRLLSKNYFNIWFGQKPVIDKLKTAFQSNR